MRKIKNMKNIKNKTDQYYLQFKIKEYITESEH